MKRSTTIRRSALARSVVVARLRKLASVAFGALLLALPAAALPAGPPPPVTSLASNNGFIVADFNHDGIPDALTPAVNSFTISFGAVPYGTFSPVAKTVPYPALCANYLNNSLVVGDFNGDGIPDLAMTCFGGQFSGYEIFILLGNGDGTFTAATPIAGESNTILGDFNQDGVLDIVTQGANASNQQVLLFYAGKGDGTFATPVTTNLPNNFYNYGLAVDINQDGYPDIVLANFQTSSTNTVDVFGNNKNGTFGTVLPATGGYAASVSVPVGTYPSASEQTFFVGNFFGNGLIDLAVPDRGTTPGVYILKNTSTATTYSFATPAKTPVTSLYGAQAASVVSTLSDLVISNGSTVTILANNGSGTFANTYASLSVGNESSEYAAVDANGDGHADIYTANFITNGASLTVSLVSGSATATSAPLSLASGANALTAVWPGNINFNGSTANGSQTVNPIATTVGLTSSLNPSTVGTSVTFTGTVSPASSGTFIPTGTLTFTDGTNQLGTFTLTQGSVSGTVNTAALAAGTHTIKVVYSGDTIFAGSSNTLSQVVNKIVPTINWSTPAAINFGTPLSATQLNATATNPTGGATIPGTFVYTPAAGTILNPGTQTLSVLFTPTDLSTYTTATGTVSILVNAAPLVLTSFTPNTGLLGDPAKTITITGSGFVASTVAQVNGTTVATTFVNATTLTAVIPASYFAATGTLQINLATTAVSMISGTLPLTVSAPPAAGTISAPATTAPGTQPVVTFTLSAPYPVALTATFTLKDTSGIASGAVDPNVLFSNGTTTFTVVIPAGTTTIAPIQIQAGTIAATITVPVTLTVNGVTVNTGNLAATIVVPPAVPAVTTTTLTRSGTTLTVTESGFSNTREIVSASFHFTPVAGASLTTSDFTAPVGPAFTTWFATPGSLTYGSAFSYQQIFDVSDDADKIASVQVTLTNSVGVSTTQTAQ
jgi:hypothetical protein